MPYKNEIYLKNTFYNVNLVRRDRNKVCQFLIWEMAKAKKVRLKLKKTYPTVLLSIYKPANFRKKQSNRGLHQSFFCLVYVAVSWLSLVMEGKK